MILREVVHTEALGLIKLCFSGVFLPLDCGGASFGIDLNDLSCLGLWNCQRLAGLLQHLDPEQQAESVVQDKKLQGKSRPPKAPKGAQIYPASLPHSMNSRGRNR